MADEPDLSRAYALARDALDRQPTRTPLAEQLVTLYATYLERPASYQTAEQRRIVTACTQPGCTGTIVDG